MFKFLESIKLKKELQNLRIILEVTKEELVRTKREAEHFHKKQQEQIAELLKENARMQKEILNLKEENLKLREDAYQTVAEFIIRRLAQ